MCCNEVKQKNTAMKNLIGLLVMIIVGSASTSSAQEFSTQGQADISFEKTVHDFGKIKQGEPVTYKFKLTNTGDAPLVIEDVEPSCGCTTPNWPQSPIQAGDTAHITAKYDAEETGAFNKKIFVHTNIPFTDKTTLIIKGFVRKSNQP